MSSSSTIEFSPERPGHSSDNEVTDDPVAGLKIELNEESDRTASMSNRFSQQSISLSSPPSSVHSPHNSINKFLRGLGGYDEDADLTARPLDASSEEHVDLQNIDLAKEASVTPPLPNTRDSVAQSISDVPKNETTRPSSVTTYPPARLQHETDTASMLSYSSTSSRKARPESKLLEPSENEPLIPGIALVDFNHLIGPQIEFSDGALFKDEQIASILPFLALPDGAHLNNEDYSYFHLVPVSPRPTTYFGISCNRQIKASELLVKDEDVTRSTVQKAVVVVASKPLFGPIRDRLGVVTQALFDQRDFSETSILVDFKASLENSLRTQLTESALYMGTSLRELVHKFRNRTLLLLKCLMLQKRVMFYGHPVERLCTYQYSLISLIPGLLQNLDDCGSPPIAYRASAVSRATSLRSSDRKSLMAYLGLPLDIFGKDSFFQPYLPLQQVDLIKETRSYLCGCTNTIVTQQKDIDLVVNIETNTFEFKDQRLERLVQLTAADRKWMDNIVRDVNETWDDARPAHNQTLQFKGSEDYIRSKFEEYVTAALASVKYADFLTKGQRTDVIITGADGGDSNAIQDFNPLWISEFRRTNAFEVWDRITDPMLFDIVEARHPCNIKPNVVEDITLRLQEGLQDLHLQEQLAPTREAISRTIATGSTSFFKAVEGVRERWNQRAASPTDGSVSSTPVEISRSEVNSSRASDADSVRSSRLSTMSTTSQGGLRPLSLSPSQSQQGQQSVANDAKATLGGWGSSIGSFISQRAARLSVPRTDSNASGTSGSTGLSQTSSSSSAYSIPSPIAPSSDAPTNTVHPSTTSSSSFFSWSFSKSSSTPSLQPDLAPEQTPKNIAMEDVDATFQPRDLGEFPTPPNTNNNNVEHGVSL